MEGDLDLPPSPLGTQFIHLQNGRGGEIIYSQTVLILRLTTDAISKRPHLRPTHHSSGEGKTREHREGGEDPQVILMYSSGPTLCSPAGSTAQVVPLALYGLVGIQYGWGLWELCNTAPLWELTSAESHFQAWHSSVLGQ